MEDDILLTTLDNPFNPFTDWNAWYTYDTARGHNTCNLIGRHANPSEEVDDESAEQAMREIVLHDPTNNYIIVTPQSWPTLFNKQT